MLAAGALKVLSEFDEKSGIFIPYTCQACTNSKNGGRKTLIKIKYKYGQSNSRLDKKGVFRF